MPNLTLIQVLIPWLTVLPLVAAAATSDPPDFQREVRPILSDRCFPCHGPDAASNKADLRLDTPEGAFAALKHDAGYALVAGDPLASAAFARITTPDLEDRMPPPESKLVLSDLEIDTIRRWIETGAEYPNHWSFELLPDRVSLPTSGGESDWVRDPLDLYVAAKHAARELRPTPEADRNRWLRRVTLDLTGLPPTLDEIDAFITDLTDSAYEQVVDRLLASTAFGEHMASPWLDVARYADSYGYQSDQLSPTWPYRDWVVRALNDNLPYDRFLTWQIAGDLLPRATRDQRLATAFQRLHRMTNEGGSVELEFRTEYAADRVHTFGTAFLGLTLECARCHDHKFDPIPQRDYYRLFAYFNAIDEWGMYHDSSRVPTPSLLLPTPSQEQAIRAIEAQIADIDRQIATLETTESDTYKEWRMTSPLVEVPSTAGHYSLDNRTDQHTFVNEGRENPAKARATTSAANVSVDGRFGRAVQLSGDDPVNCTDTGNGLRPWEAFTVTVWLWIPQEIENAIVFHRTGGTDVGRFGTELSLVDGRLRLATARFWPGNAIAIDTATRLPKERWVSIAARSDGIGRASGLTLFVDGVETVSEVIVDRLTKAPHAGGKGVAFGERFRDKGLKGARIDEVRIDDRSLSGLEIRLIAQGPQSPESDSNAEPDPAPTEVEWRDHYRRRVDPDLAARRLARRQLLENLFGQRDRVLETMVMEETKPRDSYLLARGAYDAPRTPESRVDRGTPIALPPLPHNASKNRLGLARWLLDPNHPLTARVAVNRVWQHFFGRGLVATSEDFGLQGTAPSHPRLLDHLARTFIESKWDHKQLCRRIVLSATYRQTSSCSPNARTDDPENQWLARGPSRRLSAEMLRDLALAASGLLDQAVGGPPVSPYQPAGLWREANTMSPAYRQSTGTALYRRSLYTVWKRTAPSPSMAILDAAHRESCVTRRPTTNTPLQALVLLNDIQFVEAARVLAEEVVTAALEGSILEVERITVAFRRLTGRPPDPFEYDQLSLFWSEQRSYYRDHPEDAKALATSGDHPRHEDLEPADVAATTQVVLAILNLDATVWSR